MKVTNSLDLSGNRAINMADAVNPQDAVTKAQLDAATLGLKWKEPVRAATTANITLSGLQTIDGVALAANDRVLVKNQSTGSANGIYLAQSGAWTRASDFDSNAELLGASAFVSEGTTQGNQQWQLTTDAPLVIGTTALVFAQFGGGASYTAGNGISIAGSVISVDTAVTARKASGTIGDGTATTLSFTHNLNTKDVVVSVRLVANDEVILADVVVNTVNTVQITASVPPAAGAWRVTVVG